MHVDEMPNANAQAPDRVQGSWLARKAKEKH